MTLDRRLLPLYASSFLQGIVFWYAVEKLFMTKLGFNDATIAVMVAAYSAMMLLVETPSGILADRWSRKGVLILASIALVLSSLISGIATTPFVFVIGSILWGVYYALYSGTYESIIYDVLIEEQGNGDEFETYYGRIRIFEGLSLVIGAFVGGAIGQFVNLRAPFLLSIPLTLVSFFTLARFVEPTVHKAEAIVSLKHHVSRTMRAVLQRGTAFQILLALIAASLITEMLFEFNQLWLIALAAPVIYYGPASGFLLATIMVSGPTASLIHKLRRWGAPLCIIGLGASSATLSLSHNLYVVTTAQIVLAIIALAIQIILTKQFQDQLSSSIRAGASSAVSTLTRIILIPVALLFGYISREYSIFTANAILIIIVLIVTTLLLRRQLTAPISADDALDVPMPAK